jgi:hypothetical protein
MLSQPRILKVKEPRLDIKPTREFLAKIGASNINVRREPATSKTSSIVSWSIITPNSKIGLDRRIWFEYTIKLTSASAAGVVVPPPATWLETGSCGPRQFPISSCARVSSVTVNSSQNLNLSPQNEILHAIMNYGNDDEDRQYWLGGVPHKPDYTMSYEDASAVALRGPFTSYQNCDPNEDSRQVSQWMYQSGNSLYLRCYECLWLSPFYTAKESYQCLFNVQNLNFTMTMDGQLTRMFSGQIQNGSADAPASGTKLFFDKLLAADPARNIFVSYEFQDAYAHLTYLTPQVGEDFIVPDYLEYPLHTIEDIPQNVSEAPVYGQEFEVVYNSQTLSNMPKRVYLWCQKRDKQAIDPDVFCSLIGVKVDFLGQAGRLAELNEFDLWNIAVKHGLKRSFIQWTNGPKSPNGEPVDRLVGPGSVACLEFGEDITLPSDALAPSVRGSFQIQITCRYRNTLLSNYDITQPQAATTMQAHQAFVYEGVYVTDARSVAITVGSLTQDAVAAAPYAPEGFRLSVNDFYGSGIWGDIWSGVKKAAKYALPVARGIADVVGQVAPNMGPRGQAVGAVANSVKRALGGAYTGGARVRGAQLQNRC